MFTSKNPNMMYLVQNQDTVAVEKGYLLAHVLQHPLRLPSWLAGWLKPHLPTVEVVGCAAGNDRFIKDGHCHISAVEAIRERNIDIQTVFLLLPPFR
jgi:hypothetical protein